MRVHFVGNPGSRVLAYLRAVEARVTSTTRPLLTADPRVRRADFLVSHGYVHKVRPGVLRRFPGRAINLHDAMLPWNRGLYPIPWSLLEDTPRGVTIHHMDAGIDTGPIIAQREVPVTGDETLREVVARFDSTMLALFHEHWGAIRAGERPGTPQSPGGSRHLRSEREELKRLLGRGLDTPVSELTRRGPTS